MPRRAREKSPEYIYHIMCRSVSEFPLFRDNEDKSYYLSLLKRYTDKCKCSIYAYCLLDNHMHIHLDPRGFDVSKFMHSTNTAYVRYYNKKYKRHGHVFQERFESRVLASDEYNLTVSAYIHNNAQDIDGYNGKEQQYPYSSYGIYLGIGKDTHKLIDKSFIMGLFNVATEEELAKRYGEFVSLQKDTGNTGKLKLKKELSSAVANEYRGDRRVILRDHLPLKLISYISNRLMIPDKNSIILKSKQRVMGFRAFCAYAMRTLCGMSYKEICENMYNITVSGCSCLCSRGYELVVKNADFRNIFDELLNKTVSLS